MAEIKGLGLGGMITPGGDSANTFPTHEDIYGKGGYMAINGRNTIPQDRAKKGMLVCDITDGYKIYKLTDIDSSGTYSWEELKMKYDGGGKCLGIVNATSDVKGDANTKIGDFYRAGAQFTYKAETAHVGDLIMATSNGASAAFDVLHTEQTTDTTVTSNGAGAIINLTGTNRLTATKSPINGLNYQSADGNSKTCSCWRNGSFNNFTCTTTQETDCKTWNNVAPSSSAGVNFAVYTSQLQKAVFAGYTGYITIQVKVKSNLDLKNTGCKFGCNTDGNYDATFYDIPKNTWTTVTHTFQIANWAKDSAYVYFYTGTADTTQTISLKEFKLELGPVATPWTPAYTDFLDLSTMSALKTKYATSIQETYNHDLNSLDPSMFISSHNYDVGNTHWLNEPNGMSYGQVLQLPCSVNGTIVTQLAFDVKNADKGSTKDFWVRTGNPSFYKNNSQDPTIDNQDKSWKLSTWKRVAWADELKVAGTAVNSIKITSGDLNNYKTPGFYYCPFSSDAALLSNCPVRVAFNLVVKQAAGYIQELTTYESSGWKKYERHWYSETAWGSWKQVSGYNDIYLPLTGGTLTGKVDIKADNGVSLTAEDIVDNKNYGISIRSTTDAATNEKIVISRGSIQEGYVTSSNTFVAQKLRLQPIGGSVSVGPPNNSTTNLTMTSGTSPQITIGPSVIKYNSSTGCLEIQG